jgi:hypothetical protein
LHSDEDDGKDDLYGKYMYRNFAESRFPEVFEYMYTLKRKAARSVRPSIPPPEAKQQTSMRSVVVMPIKDL